MKSLSVGMVSLISVFAISLALAQGGSSSQSNVLASGEVTKVDTAAGKISIRHGPIESLGMAAAGIDEFQAKEPIMLNALRRRGLVFTSNRGENTVSVFAPGAERESFKIAVGMKPNGLAFDPARGILIAANVGDPAIPDSYTVSIVDIARRERIAEVKVPGRTRWAIYDEARELFFVNIASPPRIVVIDARDPTRIAREYDIPAAGPHGLDLDPATGRLLCACDAGVLLAIDSDSGEPRRAVDLSGTPDVIFLHAPSNRLYVAVGDPGVIDVIDVQAMRREEVVTTEAGAHTLALDRKRSKVYAFLPQSHRAAVFHDTV